MSRSSPAFRVLVPLLAGAQALLLACSTYVLVMGDLEVVRPVEPVAQAPYELPAVGGLDWSAMDLPSSTSGRERVEKRTTRKQRPIVQARTATPPDPKEAGLSWPV